MNTLHLPDVRDFVTHLCHEVWTQMGADNTLYQDLMTLQEALDNYTDIRDLARSQVEDARGEVLSAFSIRHQGNRSTRAKTPFSVEGTFTSADDKPPLYSKPYLLLFKGEEGTPVKAWKEVLVQVAEHIIKKGVLPVSRDIVGKKEDACRNPVKLSNGKWLKANLPLEKISELVLSLCQRAGRAGCFTVKYRLRR